MTRPLSIYELARAHERGEDWVPPAKRPAGMSWVFVISLFLINAAFGAALVTGFDWQVALLRMLIWAGWL